MAKIKLTLPVISGGGGGVSDTNLSYIPNPIQGTVTSDTGTDATLPLADGTNAGLITPAEKTKIENSIPLSGTTVGNPMVGTFETAGVTFVGNTGVIQHSLELDDNIAMRGFDGTYTSKFVLNLNADENSFQIGSDNPSFRGLSSGGEDYSANITDLDYPQKIYVDTKEPLKGIDDNYVTDAEKVVIGNTSGTNTGDQDLSGKQNQLTAGTNITIDVTDPLNPVISATGGGIIDATPTDGSTNAVQSNGVFDALALKQNTLTNPITGTGTTNYLPKFTGAGTLGNSSWKESATGGRLFDGADNGVDQIQVNGTISATSYTGSATLTDTPTAPTATAGTNTTQIATTAFVQSELTVVNSDFLLYSMSF